LLFLTVRPSVAGRLRAAGAAGATTVAWSQNSSYTLIAEQHMEYSSCYASPNSFTCI
jgi:hypothetical protein